MKYPYKLHRRKTDFDYMVHIEMVFDSTTFYQQLITLTYGKDRIHLARELKKCRNKMKKNIIELIEKYRKDLSK